MITPAHKIKRALESMNVALLTWVQIKLVMAELTIK
jgi:hypothetical protein